MGVLLLPSLILSIICFTAFVILSMINYKRRYNVKYNIKNMFPYEFNFESSFKDNLLGNVFLIIGSASIMLFYISFYQSCPNKGLSLITLFGGVIAALMMGATCFVPVNMLKTHLAIAVAFFALTLFSYMSFGLLMINEYTIFNQVKSLVMGIVNFFFALICFVIIMNPKLTHWGDLKEETNSDGTKYYVRPKIFVLAFSEWLMMFLLVGSTILGFITHLLF